MHKLSTDSLFYGFTHCVDAFPLTQDVTPNRFSKYFHISRTQTHTLKMLDESEKAETLNSNQSPSSCRWVDLALFLQHVTLDNTVADTILDHSSSVV